MIQNKYTIITIDTGTKLIIDNFENQYIIVYILIVLYIIDQYFVCDWLY